MRKNHIKENVELRKGEKMFCAVKAIKVEKKRVLEVFDRDH